MINAKVAQLIEKLTKALDNELTSPDACIAMICLTASIIKRQENVGNITDGKEVYEILVKAGWETQLSVMSRNEISKDVLSAVGNKPSVITDEEYKNIIKKTSN